MPKEKLKMKQNGLYQHERTKHTTLTGQIYRIIMMKEPQMVRITENNFQHGQDNAGAKTKWD